MINALKTPCQANVTGVCPLSTLLGHSLMKSFQASFHYGPEVGNFCGVTNPFLTDPLASDEFVARGGSGPAGLWLHPDSARTIATILGGDKDAHAAAVLATRALDARGLARALALLTSHGLDRYLAHSSCRLQTMQCFWHRCSIHTRLLMLRGKHFRYRRSVLLLGVCAAIVYARIAGCC